MTFYFDLQGIPKKGVLLPLLQVVNPTFLGGTPRIISRMCRVVSFYLLMVIVVNFNEFLIILL